MSPIGKFFKTKIIFWTNIAGIGVCLASVQGFPGGPDGKESACNMGDLGSIPGLERSPGGRACQPTPVFLPGASPRTEEPGGL